MIAALLSLSWLTRFAADAPCSLDNGFFGLPHWYQFLPGTLDAAQRCVPQITSINDIWLIVAAIIEILLRVSALLAIGFVIWGGFQFIKSQGEPDATTRARQTVFDAIIGLVIAVAAATAVTFFAGQFK